MGDGGGGGDSPASSSSGASQCSPSAPTAAAAAGPYVLTTENISRMLDGWAGRKGARGGSPGMPGDAESTSTGSSDASEVSYGGAAVAPAAGGPVFENETKPAVPPSQQMPLSAIESWLFDDDNHFNTGLGRMLARRPRVPKVLDVHRRAAEVINDSFDTEAIFRGTYWTRFWSLLQKEEDCHLMKMGCKTIEIVAMEVFARHGWSFRNRLPG